jgi:PiT family inorganic phosphate transporter
MAPEYYILIIGYIFGFYMAWNIGANDVANSMASAVGAKAITIRQAVFIAGILNIVGAVFIGAHVTKTIRKGIVSTEIMSDPHVALIGALSALLAAALWAVIRAMARKKFFAKFINKRGGHAHTIPFTIYVITL